MSTKFLPKANWTTQKPSDSGSKTTAPRGSIDRTASRAIERQKTLAAENDVIRVTYGLDRIGAQIANVLVHNGRWIVQCVWGEGPINSISEIDINDELAPGTVLMSHYLGTHDQTPDVALATAFAAKGIVYDDALPGIAYTVLAIPGDMQWDRITALIEGRKVFDPRTGLVEFSKNPSLVLADFLTNDVYGADRVVDWASVAICADANDEQVNGLPRRSVNITLDKSTQIDSWIDTLRTYAGCLEPILGPNGWKLIHDRPTAVSRSYSHDAGEILSISPIKKRGQMDSPTVVRLTWTDTTSKPWRDREVVAQLPGVSSGQVPRREQAIQLPGIHSESQAYREAVERLNKLTLSDITTGITVFDESLSVEPGDVVSVSHPVGLSAKQFRVVGLSGNAGRYSLDLAEYDPAVYSDAIMTEPTSDDTDLPSPTEPSPVTNLQLAEEVYQLQTGVYSSRIVVTWDAPANFPFVDSYQITLRANGELVFTGSARGTTWRSASVQEGVTYSVEVVTVSIVGVASAGVFGDIEALGKNLPPGNVPYVDGFEVGGEVRLQWRPAIDIDIWRYEVRYVQPGGTWAEGRLIDRIDGLRMVAAIIPAGTWDFHVRALDSVGHYSPESAVTTITVTLDDEAFLVDEIHAEAPSWVGMAEYKLGRRDTIRRWATEDNILVADRFTDPLDTYNKPIHAYCDVDSSWTTESIDFGLMLSGNWSANITARAIDGTYNDHIDLSADGSNWQSFSGTVAKFGGRFARTGVTALAGSTIRVELPEALIRIDATPRIESGEATSMANGPVTITLENPYAAVRSITITPVGIAPRTYSIDNITVGFPTSFDVYLWDMTGIQVASGFRWDFRGV